MKTAFVTKINSLFGNRKLKKFEPRNEYLQSRIQELEKSPATKRTIYQADTGNEKGLQTKISRTVRIYGFY